MTMEAKQLMANGARIVILKRRGICDFIGDYRGPRAVSALTKIMAKYRPCRAVIQRSESVGIDMRTGIVQEWRYGDE